MNWHFFKNLSSKQRKIIIIAGSVLVIACITLYLFIPVIAKQAIHKKIAKVEQERNVNIDMEQLRIAHFSIFGTFDIRIKDLSVQDKTSNDRFLHSDKMSTKVQVWKGFKRTLILKDVEADNLKIHAVKQNGKCNYNFIKSTGDGTKSERNYQKMVTKWLGKVSDICPTHMEIDKLTAVTDIDSSHVRYTITDWEMRSGKGTGKAVVQDGSARPESWAIACNVDKKKQQYSGSIVRDGGAQAKGSLPFLRLFEQMDVQLHDANGHFTLLKSGKKHTACQLSGTIHGLQCQHHYIADVPVRIDSVGADIQLAIFPKTIEIDSTSMVKLNRAALHPYLRFSNDKSKHIVFKLNEKDREAEPLFASLPADLFQVIPNMKFAGKIDFNCLLDCDFGNLDSLKFDFNIINKQRSLRITEGLGEVTRFNEPFEYTFYDHGEPIRTVMIGPDNPYFCPSYAIPELLKQAILASEDGAFFVHNGFCKSAMRQAIVDDIKAGKMRRGGSTITQQLVKNLFLSRKKVLTRKFEEMVLVWLIEDQHLISKERMFEIYVNIVEWAPGIIGIGEAAQFYFHKQPSELTMPECIYLATLIRAPKHYAGTLNPDGTLTEVKRNELDFVADRMVIREFMTEGQRANFDSNIKTVIVRNDN
ncbi:MAG: transglycosylase domain-containing protein [Bacteroidales bacterium]|nr:transglycosylase domain-containing protein [Bacteroidales bacterium]